MNTIHPTAVIGAGVQMGLGNVIGPFAVVGGGARLGDGNWIGAHAIVGAPPEVRGVEHRADWIDRAENGVSIGDRNVLREAVQIHAGWKGMTRLGDDCFVMNQSYLAHDVELADGVTLASSVTLAGHVRVGSGANLGLGAHVHQGLRIGAYAMVGMGAVVTRDIPPFIVSRGSPARQHRANAVGMERAGFATESVAWVASWVAEGCPVLDGTDPSVPEALRGILDGWRETA